MKEKSSQRLLVFLPPRRSHAGRAPLGSGTVVGYVGVGGRDIVRGESPIALLPKAEAVDLVLDASDVFITAIEPPDSPRANCAWRCPTCWKTGCSPTPPTAISRTSWRAAAAAPPRLRTAEDAGGGRRPWLAHARARRADRVRLPRARRLQRDLYGAGAGRRRALGAGRQATRRRPLGNSRRLRVRTGRATTPRRRRSRSPCVSWASSASRRSVPTAPRYRHLAAALQVQVDVSKPRRSISRAPTARSTCCRARSRKAGCSVRCSARAAAGTVERGDARAAAVGRGRRGRRGRPA
jgi:hypothetical protein